MCTSHHTSSRVGTKNDLDYCYHIPLVRGEDVILYINVYITVHECVQVVLLHVYMYHMYDTYMYHMS